MAISKKSTKIDINRLKLIVGLSLAINVVFIVLITLTLHTRYFDKALTDMTTNRNFDSNGCSILPIADLTDADVPDTYRFCITPYIIDEKGMLVSPAWLMGQKVPGAPIAE